LLQRVLKPFTEQNQFGKDAEPKYQRGDTAGKSLFKMHRQFVVV